jgi:hypothetical protein
MIDRTTKLLLAVIAVGVWANFFSKENVVRPAMAQDAAYFLRAIDSKIGILVNGVCVNSKLC